MKFEEIKKRLYKTLWSDTGAGSDLSYLEASVNEEWWTIEGNLDADHLCGDIQQMIEDELLEKGGKPRVSQAKVEEMAQWLSNRLFMDPGAGRTWRDLNHREREQLRRVSREALKNIGIGIEGDE